MDDIWQDDCPDRKRCGRLHAEFPKEYETPSLITVDDRAVKLAFADVVPLAATPSTLVLDSEGRVAARVIGQLPGASILKTLVSDVLAENS